MAISTTVEAAFVMRIVLLVVGANRIMLFDVALIVAFGVTATWLLMSFAAQQGR